MSWCSGQVTGRSYFIQNTASCHPFSLFLYIYIDIYHPVNTIEYILAAARVRCVQQRDDSRWTILYTVTNRSFNLLPPPPPPTPSKTVIPGRIKVFGTKLHRESSIHAAMFFSLSSDFSRLPSIPFLSFSSQLFPSCLLLVAHCYTFRAVFRAQ